MFTHAPKPGCCQIMYKKPPAIRYIFKRISPLRKRINPETSMFNADIGAIPVSLPAIVSKRNAIMKTFFARTGAYPLQFVPA
jgi:hypothetical protein